MQRIGIVLALAAAPLIAQQVPVRPPLPDPAPLPMPAPAAAAAARADARRDAQAVRADAQAARADALQQAADARADAMAESRAAMSEARVAQLDAMRDMRIAMPAIASQSFNLDVRPAIAAFGQGFGSGFGQGFASTYSYDYSYSPKAPQGWAPQDPADSIYRQAQQAMNRGDYRRAASMFKDLPVKQPNSVYAPDALYWQAFSLYRIGGTTELQEALAALDQRKAKYPAGRIRGDADPALATRIAGVLSARGLGDKDLVKRALTEGSGTCDTEDQGVRAEALNALRQTDPDEALAQAKKILGRKDDCSAQLRRSALWMIANKKDAAATATLVSVAKNDPSLELRAEATGFLGSIGGDEALAALEDLLKSDDERVQRAAVRALTTYPSSRARTAMRSLIENNGANEQLRSTALDAFSSERSTLEDASWLRSIYAKVDNARIKARIVSAVARIGGDQNEQWLMSLAKNEDESVDVRQSALRSVARTADIGNLNKFYDGISARPLREEIINALGDRKEPEATDKLIDIARSGTDPQVRRSAINTLTRKKDPRTTKLLLELISGDAPAKKP
jgi:HEAT repeat protein/TolA-binding protein